MKYLPLLLLCGCASFTVEQVDDSHGERKITTKIKGTAWFSSAQSIAKLKATQTDKTQTFGSEAFGQQGATNTVDALHSVVRILELLSPKP